MSWKRYQHLWRQHNTFPAPCHFCGDPVTRFGKTRYDGSIHHLDGDHSNDELTNLAIAHQGCHVSHHTKGKPVTDAQRAAISATLQGHAVDPVSRVKIAESLRGRSRPDISARLIGLQQPRVVCDRCGRTISEWHLRRHQSACSRRLGLR